MSIHTNARSIIKFSFSSLLEFSAGRILFRFRVMPILLTFFMKICIVGWNSICTENSSDHTTNEFSHCFIIHPRQFLDRCLFTIFIYLFLDKFSVQIKKKICLVLKIFFKQHTSSCIWCFLAYIFRAKRLKFSAIFYSWNQSGPQRFLVAVPQFQAFIL